MNWIWWINTVTKKGKIIYIWNHLGNFFKKVATEVWIGSVVPLYNKIQSAPQTVANPFQSDFNNLSEGLKTVPWNDP